jgi:hypothetical protein
MLRSLTNESSGGELDTLKIWMIGPDLLSRTSQRCRAHPVETMGSRRVGQRATASGSNSGSQFALGGLL